jgi:hypothetical protein
VVELADTGGLNPPLLREVRVRSPPRALGKLGDGAADRLRQEVFNTYPKPADGGYIKDAIINHASRSDAAAPTGSLAAQLLLQQRRSESARR